MIVLLPMVGKRIVCDLKGRIAKGILQMWEGPGSVNFGRSTSCCDDLNKAGCKRQWNSLWIISDVIDRVGLAPELTRIVWASPRVGCIASVHWDTGLILEKLLHSESCEWFDGSILLIIDDWFVVIIVDDGKCVGTWKWDRKFSCRSCSVGGCCLVLCIALEDKDFGWQG